MAATVRGTIRGMGQRANPAFAGAVVAFPLVALGYTFTAPPVQHHTYVHVMTGVLWTGIDLFMALVLGPVLGSLDVEERANVFQRFTPKMTFLMPTLATVTIVSGITLAQRRNLFPNADPWLALLTAAAVVPILALLGWQFDALRDRRWQALTAVGLVGTGAFLATTLPEFGATNDAVAVALAIVVLLTVIGFGVLLPGEVRIYREMTSVDPDPEVIGAIGLRNAKLAGVQGVLQLSIVVVMVYLRWGGF